MTMPDAPRAATRGRWSGFVRYGIAGAMLIGVIVFLMRVQDEQLRGIGIFAAIVAVILTRLLVLGPGEPGEPGGDEGDDG